MIEVWKKNLDKGNEIAVTVMDLSKAFDIINHSLLPAKLEGYGFSMASPKPMQSSLCNRFQRTSVNASLRDLERNRNRSSPRVNTKTFIIQYFLI